MFFVLNAMIFLMLFERFPLFKNAIICFRFELAPEELNDIYTKSLTVDSILIGDYDAVAECVFTVDYDGATTITRSSTLKVVG